MKKRQQAAAQAQSNMQTSLSTDNLAKQPNAKMSVSGMESLDEDTKARPLSQGSGLSSALPSKNMGSRGTGRGLSDIGDGRSTRASSRGEFRLNKNFALKFIYDLDGIVIPEKLLFDDYVARRPSTTVDLRGWIVNKGLFRAVQEKCKPVLQELLLEDCLGLSAPMLETLRGSSRLRVLNVASTGIDITFQVAQILGSLSRLVELNISGCKVDITSFSIVCNTCQALNSLTCQACPGLDDFCLQALAACMQRFRRLQQIDLSKGISYGDEGYISVLGATPKLLTKLNMSNTAVLSSLAITSLRTKMPALTYLDMSDMKLAQTCFEWVTEGCVNLETLILTRCENLDDIAMIKMGSKLHRLQKVVVNHCSKLTDEGVCGFFNQLTASLDLQLGKGLRYVDISSNILLGGPPVQALADYERKAQHINGCGIVELRMNGLSMVTAPALMSIWKNCTSLKRFIMAVEMSTAVTHRRSMMPHISDRTLVDAMYHTLEEVNLSGCCLITDTGVCSLIEKCHKQLRSLDVSYCSGVTDISVYFLSEYCGKALRELNLGGCNKVTNHGLIALCTDHSDVRRKKKLVNSVMKQDVFGGKTQDKYVAYSRKQGEFAEDSDENQQGSSIDDHEGSGIEPATLSKHKHNFSLDVLNPFPTSAGCLLLTALRLNGCFKITDPGVVAMCNLKDLKTLSIRNLDNVTDSPLLLMAESCTKLSSLDISSLDLVSINVVHAFVKNCYKLETFNCDLCNFTASDYGNVIRPKLPLGMPNGLRSKLEPRPRPVLEYNRFVVQTRDCRFAAWKLTKFANYCIAWSRQRNTKKMRRQAIETIKDRYFDYLNRHRLYHAWGTKNQRIRCSNILQKWAKKCLGSKTNSWKARDKYRREKNALFIQRVFRGHKARKRTRNKFRRLFYFYNMIGHMVHKYWVLYYVRIFHKRLIQVQSIGRMFPPKLTYILTRRSIITFQIKIRRILKRKRDCRAAMDRIFMSLEGEAIAANVIRKNWRIKMFNKQMSTFVFICAIYWRTLDDEKDWRVFQLQAWWRGSAVRLACWRVREIPKIIFRKATKIQALWNRYRARCMFLILRKMLKRQMVAWRLWTRSCCRLRIGFITRKIQKKYKLYFFNMKRWNCAIIMQRYYRGYRVRKNIADFQYEIQSKYARKIQRRMKLWKGRRFRKQLMAIRHMAAWKIQRQIHSLFDGEAMKRIQSKQAVRRRAEILAEKARLLLVVREGSLQRRKAEFMHIFARRIQKRFRRWSLGRRKKREAMQNRLKITEEATQEIVAIKTGNFIAKVLKPLAGVGRQLSSALAALGGSSEVSSKSDKPRLTNAILRYHTRSIVQVGITALHLTVGEGERKAFELGQEMLRTSGKPFYECLKEDISGATRLKVFFWMMRGKGTDCITDLTIGRKPASSSMAQLKSRALGATVAFKSIIWHQHLHFEFCAEKSIKAGKGGFAISDVQVVATDDEAEDLEVKGYTLVADMSQYGFAAWVYCYSRTPEDEGNIFRLGMVEKQVWCDSRLLKVIYTYNLANSEVYSLRAVYESILADPLNETVKIKDVFQAFGLAEMNTIAQWMVEAIKPKRKSEMLFSEYVHMVVSMSMFGTRDIMRFLFGCIDTQQAAYLKRDQFIELINAITSGNQNPLVWILQFDTFKDRKLDSMFFAGFENFCNSYRAVLWGAESLQLAIKKKNLGDTHWSDKISHFAQQRKELGVILV